jgi:histidine triad (HIT) family protein
MRELDPMVWPRRRPVRGQGLSAEVDGECVFCRIVDGRGEASVVATTERAVAFLDLQPVTPGHVLVVPRVHSADLAGVDDADGAAVWSLARTVAGGLRAAGLAEGVNLLLADGEVAWQTVWHVHLHVIARRAGDGMALRADWTRPPREELDATAARVRAALAG